MASKSKYIFVTGGVLSSLGKGLTAASIAMLLEARGLKVAMLKFDPYLNVDPGTMNPFQHGEVYVTDDGTETDLDLGHYFRYSNAKLSKDSNVTSGQVYDSVIRKERRGDFLGKTVQVIPHITDEIKTRIITCAQNEPDTDVTLIEIGGTVGDIESLPFLEAIRQFISEHRDECMTIHLTYVPYLKAAGEVKTKPTQHSVQALRQIGIIPDIIICRTEVALSEEIKDKIALFCSVQKEMVLDEKDVEHSIYEVPLMLHQQTLDTKICNKLSLSKKTPDLSHWNEMLTRLLSPKKKVTVGVVGKYMQHQDAYKSVFESLIHGGIANEVSVEIKCFESDKLKEKGAIEKEFEGLDGILVPGGFGERGWMGKILTAKYCRENNIPYFGICLGMQVMCVEFARHVLGLTEANSTEFDPEGPDPIISLLEEQKEIENIGGTMRLGAYKCAIKPNTKASIAYATDHVFERHRHRYEFNNKYQKQFEDKGLILSGLFEKDKLCEIAEIKDHPWMVGVQFHPEFRSKPTNPHPLFKDFIKAMVESKK